MSTGVATISSKVVNIRPATGKIFFRAKSGGLANAYARLYSVSLITGRCEDPLCSFDTTYNERACDFWEWKGWTVAWVTLSAKGVPGNVSALGPGLPAGTLKTDLLMATGTQSACLQFSYCMTGFNDTLAVSIQHEDGCTELLWEVTNHNKSSSWSYATVPLRSHNAFFITFQGQRFHTGQLTGIAIDNVEVLRPSSCDYLPQGSKPSGQQLTSNLYPSCDLLPGTTTPTTTTSADTHMPVTKCETSYTTSPDGDMPATMPPDSGMSAPEDTSNITVIAASVAGGVVFIAVIISGVLVWRRRRQQRNSRKANDFSNEGTAVISTRKDEMEPPRETAGSPDIPSAKQTHYDGLGELSPQSHSTSLVGTEPASEAASSYYNIVSDGSTQQGRREPRTRWPAETPYESFGEKSPPSVYKSLKSTAAASDTGTYYSNDFAQDTGSYYNVTPGNSA